MDSGLDSSSGDGGETKMLGEPWVGVGDPGGVLGLLGFVGPMDARLGAFFCGVRPVGCRCSGEDCVCESPSEVNLPWFRLFRFRERWDE